MTAATAGTDQAAAACHYRLLGGPDDGLAGGAPGGRPPMPPAMLAARDGSGTYQLMSTLRRPAWMVLAPRVGRDQLTYVWEPLLNHVPGG